MPRQRPMTWRFDLTLQMPAFSAQDDVRMVFSSILDDADTRLAIHDLKQSSFSYDVPGERCLAEISEYLHSSEKTTAATVKTWIFDGRKVGDIRWTAIEPGKRGDWKQHADIQVILASFNGISSRGLEDWRWWRHQRLLQLHVGPYVGSCCYCCCIRAA